MTEAKEANDLRGAIDQGLDKARDYAYEVHNLGLRAIVSLIDSTRWLNERVTELERMVASNSPAITEETAAVRHLAQLESQIVALTEKLEAFDRAKLELMVQSYVSIAVENATEAMTDSIVENVMADVDSKIESALEDFDASDKVECAMDDIDWDDKVSDALQEYHSVTALCAYWDDRFAEVMKNKTFHVVMDGSTD